MCNESWVVLDAISHAGFILDIFIYMSYLCERLFVSLYVTVTNTVCWEMAKQPVFLLPSFNYD